MNEFHHTNGNTKCCYGKHLITLQDMQENVAIFNEEDVNFVQTIVRDKRGVQGLKPIVYGFASNTSSTQPAGTDSPKVSTFKITNVYPEAFTYLKEGKGPGFKNARDAVIKISNKLLQGICFSKFGMVTCCEADATNTMEIKPNAEIPVIESLRVAVISNHVDLAAELWSQCENPLLTALVAHTYLIALADKAESLYEEELNKNLLSHSRKFLSRAIKLLDKLFQKDEDMATKALDYTSEVWGLEEKTVTFWTPIQLGRIYFASFCTEGC
ncbi:unnamed protein product [Mytilus edulis]|uniref:TRPM-like domain-containing protein n=1 Tax=Mytilus edulis TaxID=6550 RepID=A0A8S3VSZ3_MYTED|nr:unnamed protein product [Mytilus edulis]